MLNFSSASAVSANSALFGSEGKLVTVRVSVDPRHLEDLLELLANLDFPVNPELIHRPGTVLVEFPAYAGDVVEVRESLERAGIASWTEAAASAEIALGAVD